MTVPTRYDAAREAGRERARDIIMHNYKESERERERDVFEVWLGVHATGQESICV